MPYKNDKVLNYYEANANFDFSILTMTSETAHYKYYCNCKIFDWLSETVNFLLEHGIYAKQALIS